MSQEIFEITNCFIHVKNSMNDSYIITIAINPTNVYQMPECLPIVSGFKLDSNFTATENAHTIGSITSNKQLIDKLKRKEKIALYGFKVIRSGDSIN